MSSRRFELTDEKSKKFWEVSTDGAALTVRFGRIGTDGQTKTKDLGTLEAAKAEEAKLVREKTQKGYAEVGSRAAAPPAAPAPKPAAGAAPAGHAAVIRRPSKPPPKDDPRASEDLAAAAKALDDIKEWLEDQGATAILERLGAPIGDATLAAAEAKLGSPFPDALRALYRLHDGQRQADDPRNTFFPHGCGGFCTAAWAVDLDAWRKFIGPWFQPNTEYDPAWDALEPLVRVPERAVPRSWFQVDAERTKKDLLPEECTTAWLVFAWEDHFLAVVHLRTGRVFQWAKDEGLTFVADSFGAFLTQLADDLWNGRYRLVRDPYADDEPMEDRDWVWDVLR